ncbi:hypothetical protein CMI37_23300 [Candidatus Pacearchaeota archaeon]|nr:hypothetical protein [Candidatus Pacearchaeota archaeon]
MPDYKLNIIGTFNNKQLVKALRQAGVDVDKLGKKTTKTNKDLGRFRQATAGMRRTLGAVRNNLLLVSFAFGTLGAAIGKTVKDFAKFEQVNIGFKELGKSVGFSGDALNKLKEATDGTVSSMELMKQANNAMLLGIAKSEDQMAEMFDMAQRLASAVGQDATYGIESLTTGIGRQSRLMLDNLGIIVRTEDAYKAYAQQINKSVSALTDQEKKTAFITAAMDAAREKVGRLGDEQKTTSMVMSEAATSIGELSITIGELFSPLVISAAKRIADWAESFKMLIYQHNIFRGMQLEEAQILELIDFKNKQLMETQGEYAKASAEKNIFGKQTAQAGMLGATIAGMRKEIVILTEKYLAMLDVGESVAEGQNSFSEAIGETVAGLADVYPGMVLALELYKQTKEAQIALLEAKRADIAIDAMRLEGEEGQEENIRRMGVVYDMLSESLLKLMSVKKKDVKASKTQLQANTELMKGSAALLKQFAGGAIVAARLQQAAAVVDTYSAATAALKPVALGGYGPVVGPPMAAAIIASGLANVMQISKSIGEFQHAQFGMDQVVTQPTMIMAGENNQAEQVSITPLEGPNLEGPQGGNITVNVSGNILENDWIEEELSEKISEAVRRGVDFGIS